MPLNDLTKESMGSFAFGMAREFLACDESTDQESIGDRLALVVGFGLFAAIVILGLIARANS